MATATMDGIPVPRVSQERIDSALALREKAAKFGDVARFRRHTHENRNQLHKAAQGTCPCCAHHEDCGARASTLPASCHAVYAAIRTMAAKGYAGICLSGRELAKWTAIPLRTARWAMARLRNLRLVSVVHNFEEWTEDTTKMMKRVGKFTEDHGDRIAVASTHVLGPAAPQRTFGKAKSQRKQEVAHARETACTFEPPAPEKQASLDDLAAFKASVEGTQTPVQVSESTPVQELHSNSLPSSGRGAAPSGAPPSHSKTIPLVRPVASVGRPTASEGAANRRAVAPVGAQGVGRSVWAFFTDAITTRDEREERPGRALRAAKKDGGS